MCLQNKVTAVIIPIMVVFDRYVGTQKQYVIQDSTKYYKIKKNQ